MEPPTITVRARLYVLPTAEGGRKGPFANGYRPNHNFGAPDNSDMQIGSIRTPEDRDVRPGETIDVEVVFLNTPGLQELLSPGRTWRIQEADHLVAVGEVLL